VVLHIDPKRLSHLLGLCVWDTVTATPQQYYPGSAPQSAIDTAESWMDRKASMTSWDEFAEYLAEQSPYSAYWSYRDIEATDDLEALYVQLTAEVAASAVASHGHTAAVTIDGEDLIFTSAMLTFHEKITLLGFSAPNEIAQAIGGPTESFTPKHKNQPLSSRLAYFTDDTTLLVIAKRTGQSRDADLALAHGLAYRADRDLWIVVPRETADATLSRAVFIVPEIRVWTYSDTDVREEVLDSAPRRTRPLRRRLVSSLIDLGERAR
jgi:hypothetical protein